MSDDRPCEGPGCHNTADWFVGKVFGERVGRGHMVCGECLEEGIKVTMWQLKVEGLLGPGVLVRPAPEIDALSS